MPRCRLLVVASPLPVVDVRDHGAVGDGVHPDTEAIRRAIADVAARGGGTVRLAVGRYLVGSIVLASGVELALEAGATLLASLDAEDFFPVEALPYATFADVETSDFRHALLLGDGLHGVTITGDGTIDMQRTARLGPKPIALRRCERVTVAGLTIRNAPNYCVSLGACDEVFVEEVTIRDSFSDGIDPDSCRGVTIRGCDVESDDDALCLKSSLILGEPRACEDVAVRDCRLNSPSNGFKIGTETNGDVRNVDVRGCRIDGTPRPGADPAGLVLAQEGGGVAIESVDGAHVEDVRVHHVTVHACDVPIFVRLGARGRGQPTPRPGSIRRVSIADVVATGASDPCTISGIPGHPIEALTIERLRVTTAPPAAPPPAFARVPEHQAGYPRAGMFGPLPASAIYARHVHGLALRDVEVTVSGDDPRPWLATDDVAGLVVSQRSGTRAPDGGEPRHRRA